MDSQDPAANPASAFTYDAAYAVRGLLAEAKRVLLHCASRPSSARPAWLSRTPTCSAPTPSRLAATLPQH